MQSLWTAVATVAPFYPSWPIYNTSNPDPSIDMNTLLKSLTFPT